jgi:multidrug transporter EmrE-like cation transporter
MAWLLLIVAGLFEVGWAIGLKYTEGFTRPLPSLLTALSMIVSLALLGLALKTLPVGTAYAFGPASAPSGPLCSACGSWVIPRMRRGSPASPSSSLASSDCSLRHNPGGHSASIFWRAVFSSRRSRACISQ